MAQSLAPASPPLPQSPVSAIPTRTLWTDYSNINEMKFREDDLHKNNSTRYDNMVAGGSDQERFIQWVVFAAISLTVSAFVLTVFIAILSKKSVRQKPFNMYLIFLIVPDLVFSVFCGINCALNAANGNYVSSAWCQFQVVYCVWGIGTNAWLNAVIARHVHKMLLCGKNMRRYFPPSRKQVVMESMAVYLWLAFVSLWPFIEFLPHRIGLSGGAACLPHEYDTASTVFFWLVFMPCFVLIPTAYACYVAVDIWRQGLLPKASTKRRNIAVYFFRLTIVFLVMWVPSIFLMFISSGYTQSWVAFAGGCWSHLQGAVSAVVALMKQDIGEAFVEFVTCGRKKLSLKRHENGGEKSSSTSLIGIRNFHLSSTLEPPSTAQGHVHDQNSEVWLTVDDLGLNTDGLELEFTDQIKPGVEKAVLDEPINNP